MPRSRCPVVVLTALLLAVTGCARVHPHLALPAMALGEPSFFPTIEAYTAAPIVGGNTVEVLLNGEEIFPAVIDAVRAARRTITYAQYYWEDGPVAGELAEAIAERCRAGVGGNILLDSFGTLAMPTEHVDLMKRAGCHVAFFRPLTRTIFGRANNRNHRRVLVVDGRVGFIGGSGVSRKWMGNGRIADHWRDTDVRLEGPVVEYLQGAFAENWLEATGVVLGGEAYFPRPLAPRGSVYAQIVRSSPAGGSFAMYTTFLLAMASARRSVYITNPYFVLDEAMANALLSAVRRGARVVVLVPGAIDHNIVRQASRGQFGRMLRGGVEIYEYRAGLLHAKTMVIDGVWSTVGSTNLDNRSFALNEELNVVIYSATVARRFEAIFLDDLAHSGKVEYRDWRKRGLGDRVLELLSWPIRDWL
ncbi:MAG: cardiolipin synthase B [Candidatus Rokubacteria bacterium]|nr:cardiolipin synthase B [Candidatus Rokubacteria bacterium]